MLINWHQPRILAAASAVVVMLLCSSTWAGNGFKNPTNPKAKAHLQRGNRYYKLQDFKQAIVEYKAGALIEDLPVFLYNLGQSYRQQGAYANAIWYYKRYLSQGIPTSALKKWVTDVIHDMEKELQRAARTKPPTGPGPDSKVPPPSKPTPVVGSDDRTEAKPWHADTLGWTLTGAGAVSLGVGIGLLINASSLENTDEPDQIKHQMNADKADSRRLYGTISTIAGAALVIGGVIRLISNPQPKHREQAPKKHVSLVVGHNYVGLAGHF